MWRITQAFNLFVPREDRQRKSRRNRNAGRPRASHRVRLVDLTSLELLERRELLAVTASFSTAHGVLTVSGDAQDNAVAVSRDAGGTILVNNGAVTIQGGTATVANTRLIQVFGLGGNDNLSVNETNGALRSANIDGGDGNDIITGSSGNDVLTGGTGNDTFRFDTDKAQGSDIINESGGGVDALDFSATTTRAASIDLGNAAAQVVNAGLTLTLSAGNAIENVTGGALGDTLTGNSLNNVIEGGRGNDTLTGGAGNDTFRFDTDNALGNDTINESGGGIDALVFSTTTTRAVNIDLGNAAAQVVNAGLTLTLSAGNTIENVTGGALGDTLTGNTLNNVIEGGDGDDTLTGGAGNDTLKGGAANDVLIGGLGVDLLDGGPGNNIVIQD